MNGELAAIAALERRLPAAPPGETWIGDDAAVLAAPAGPLLLAADALVEGVHADLTRTSLDDLGWKALAVNVSDIAAMGGRPLHAVVTVAVPPGRARDVDALYDGLVPAAEAFGCAVVGGDLTAAPTLVVTVAVTGTVDDVDAGTPVLRSGASAGDTVFVTGPLGAAAAGLRALRGDGDADDAAHRRPVPRIAEGTAARRAGASAMLDLSDGLALDVRRLADASRVGVALDVVPAAPGATLAEALGGGDDYELLFTAPDPDRVLAGFAAGGLRAPLVVGRCTDDPAERRLGDADLPTGGWEHGW